MTDPEEEEIDEMQQGGAGDDEWEPAVADGPREQAEAEQHEEAPEAEAEAEAEGEQAEAEDDLYDEEGKLLGKFKTPEELAKSYKALEKLKGRQGQEARELRIALQEAGFTFDVDGKPVPPKASAAGRQDAPPAEAQANTGQPPLPPGWTYDEAGNRVDPQGIVYDDLGMVVLSKEDWQFLLDEDPVEAHQLLAKNEAERNRRLALRQQQQQQALAQQYEAEKRDVVQAARKYGLPDEFTQSVLPEVDAEFQKLAPEVKARRGVYSLIAKAMAFDKLPAFYQKAMEQAVADARAGKKVIAFASPGEAARAEAKGEPKDYGLTADELKIAKKFGMTPKEYKDYASA